MVANSNPNSGGGEENVPATRRRNPIFIFILLLGADHKQPHDGVPTVPEGLVLS